MLLKWPVKVTESNGTICAAVTLFTSDLGAVRQRDGIALAGRGLGFEETAHVAAWRTGRRDAVNFDFRGSGATGGQRGAAGVRIGRNGIRALHAAFWRIGLIDVGGDELVTAGVGVNPRTMKKDAAPFSSLLWRWRR